MSISKNSQYFYAEYILREYSEMYKVFIIKVFQYLC